MRDPALTARAAFEPVLGVAFLVLAAAGTAAWVLGPTLRPRAGQGAYRRPAEGWLVPARPDEGQAGRSRPTDDGVPIQQAFSVRPSSVCHSSGGGARE